jgi:hypothetical protein
LSYECVGEQSRRRSGKRRKAKEALQKGKEQAEALMRKIKAANQPQRRPEPEKRPAVEKEKAVV